MRLFFFAAALSSVVLTAHAKPGVETVAKGFERPVWVGAPGHEKSRLWVMEQAGKIWIIDSKTGERQAEPFLDLVEQAHLTFEGAAGGEIAFGALKGFLDVRYGARDGAACAEFSWQGYDDNDPACGRGWVIIGTAGRLVGHFFIHNADHSGFVCEPD